MGLYTDWSLSTLQPILAIHQTTLRYIRIRCINEGGLAGFDVRTFQNLEELCLSSATTNRGGRTNTAEGNLIPNLLAPRLRVFHWDLTFEDQQHVEDLADFAQGEEDWLRTVAYAAMKAKCPLQTLQITFTPLSIVSNCDLVYPWDRMDALGRELQSAGIQVCYNPPSVSRKEFSEDIERKRKQETITCIPTAS
jgi:hypothetical protein